MKIYMYSNRTNDPYRAEGEYKKGKVTVFKGSKIAREMKSNFRPYAYVVELRKNPEIVNDEFIVQEDIEFPSPSGAAQFVSGRSTDGLVSWKIERGLSLRDKIEGRK